MVACAFLVAQIKRWDANRKLTPINLWSGSFIVFTGDGSQQFMKDLLEAVAMLNFYLLHVHSAIAFVTTLDAETRRAHAPPSSLGIRRIFPGDQERLVHPKARALLTRLLNTGID